MNELKKLLSEECVYQLRDDVMERFLSLGEEVRLKPKEILVMSGRVNPHAYILKEGILRNTYLEGLKEITVGFALPGTMALDIHSYYMNQPAFFQIEACCESVVLKVTKENFDHLLQESHEFALWALSMTQCQLYFYEMKNSVINGDAKERFLSLCRNRPEIVAKVPLGMIASYLGVTQSYLSRLRKSLFSAKKK